MMHDTKGLPIGRLAEAAGVNVETIRFYQRKGLLETPEKPVGGTRRYSDSALARIKFIKAAKGLAFSLNDIMALVALDDGTHCKEAAIAADVQLAEVRQKIRSLQNMEKVLVDLRQRCDSNHGQVSCPLIDALYSSE